MILTKKIIINVKSPITIKKLREINIYSNMGDVIIINIDKLWKSSTIKLDVKCDVCKKEKKLGYNKYVKNTLKYNIYTCSSKCSNIKNKKTLLEKYGDENYNNREKAKITKKEKYGDENYNNRIKNKETCLKKYGVENILQSEEIKKKTKKTLLEKYGDENFRNKEKANKTKKERYGNENYNNRTKYKETCLEKYGVDSTNKLEFVKIKKQKTSLKNYGFVNNSMSKICKDKLKQTNLKKYGVEYVMQVKEFADKQFKNSLKFFKYKNYDIWYQSTYELDFLNYCEEINIFKDIKRGKTIKYVFENKNKIYYSDFYYEPLNLIIEIKPNYIYEKYKDKNIAKKEQCIIDKYNYLFIIDKNYTDFNKILND